MQAPVEPLENELWRQAPGYEGLYAVSSMGRVFSFERVYPSGWRRGPRLLRLFLTKAGYLKVDLKDMESRRTSWQVHRLVALAFHGAPQPGQMVRHLNGVRTDNRLENLAWGTRSENAYDSVRHGTHPMSSKKRCKRGHPYEGDNLVIDHRGRRACRTCMENRVKTERRRATEKAALAKGAMRLNDSRIQQADDGALVLTLCATDTAGRNRISIFAIDTQAAHQLRQVISGADAPNP